MELTTSRGPELYRIAEGYLGAKWRAENPGREYGMPDFFPIAKEMIDSGQLTAEMLAPTVPSGRANPDGSLSHDASGANGFDFGNVLLAGSAAAIGGLGLGLYGPGAAVGSLGSPAGAFTAAEELAMLGENPAMAGSAAGAGISAGTIAGTGGATAAGAGLTASQIASALGISEGAVKALGIGAGALLGSANGAKQAGTPTTVQDIPDWLKPYATNLLDQGQGIVNANKVTPDTFSASDNALNGIINGGAFQAPTSNPYGGQTTAPTSNSYIGQTVTPDKNPYMGMNNPYFESVLAKSLNDTQGRVNNQFGNGNAFGNSANQELLARSLGDQANAMRYGEHNTQIGLEEAGIARRLQAQQADLARNAGLMQNQGQFNANLYANDLNRNANLFNTDAARNQNAFQYGTTQKLNAATALPGYTAGKTNAAFAPLNAQRGLFTSGVQTTSPYFNNPGAGALYGGLLGSQLFGGK